MTDSLELITEYPSGDVAVRIKKPDLSSIRPHIMQEFVKSAIIAGVNRIAERYIDEHLSEIMAHIDPKAVAAIALANFSSRIADKLGKDQEGQP